MSVRRASSVPRVVLAAATRPERAPVRADEEWGLLEWQGDVRLAVDRARGMSLAGWQTQVRTGLLERLVALGVAYRAGPHSQRPAVATRFLAHVDALAEAGASHDDLLAFTEGAALEQPGVLWALTLLFGSLEAPDADEAFESWAASLEPSCSASYAAVREIADALGVQPNPVLRSRVGRWVSNRSAFLGAISVEVHASTELADASIARLIGLDSPLLHVAVTRFLARGALQARHRAPAPRLWTELPFPALSFEAARARMLARDPEPMARVRRLDQTAVEALGPCAVDLVAIAGDEEDQHLTARLVRGQPTTSRLLDAIGRCGFPLLVPRLMAELESEEFDDDAHRALTTMLGPRVDDPSVAGWTQEIAALHGRESSRLRGGAVHSRESVLAELRRTDLSVLEVRARADELFAAAGTEAPVEWETFGTPLDRAISALAGS